MMLDQPLCPYKSGTLLVVKVYQER